MGRMSTSDYGRQWPPEQGRPEYPQTDYTQPVQQPANPGYDQVNYEQPNYGQSYGQQGYNPDAEATQPVAGHFTSPRVDWDSTPAWETDEEPPGNFGRVLLALGVGSLVAVGLGVYGSLHEPTGQALNLAGFSSGLHAKAWLATASFVLVIVQLLSALAMWGRLPGVAGGGPVSAKLHKWSGRLAVLISLPVAAHCLYALGFQSFDTRVVLHSLLGCFFYGIFVCKMIVLAREDQKPWVIPVLGGVVFTALTALWLTSSLWFFSNVGVQL
jgi:Family of unknown function (DUF6529)